MGNTEDTEHVGGGGIGVMRVSSQSSSRETAAVEEAARWLCGEEG